MITRAIVERVLPGNVAQVRIPILDAIKSAPQATPTDELSIATMCVIPNSYNHISVGDIVFVGFEDKDYGKPVILGQLFKEYDTLETSGTDTKLDLKLRSIDIASSANLPKNTVIGDVSAKEIQCLAGLEFNIAKALQEIEQRLKDLGG